MRVLFFLYFLPPAPGTAPKRNSRIATAIAAKSQFAIALTVKFPGKNPIPIPGMEIIPITALDYRTWLRSRTKDGYLAETTKKQAWKQFFIRLINSFPFNILLGEGGLLYFFRLLRKGQQLIDRHQITHLYSSFRPFTDHYAAYWLKKRNPSLCWIADFRDVIVDPHYGHILWPEAHQRFFKRMFHKADLITTVSNGLAKSLRGYGDKVIVVRNGIDLPLKKVNPVHTPEFTIVYTGSMMLDTRNPGPVFVALRSLLDLQQIIPTDLKIIYAGKDGNQWTALANEYQLSDCFTNYGIIEGEKASLLQRDACINLLLTASSPELQGVLTGKWIEYVEAGSPVLGIVKGNIDLELKELMVKLQIGKCFTDSADDLQAISDFILQEYQYWKNSGTNRKPANTVVIEDTFGMHQVMQPLMDAL